MQSNNGNRLIATGVIGVIIARDRCFTQVLVNIIDFAAVIDQLNYALLPDHDLIRKKLLSAYYPGLCARKVYP